PDRRCLLVYYGGNGEEVSYNLDSFKHITGCAVLLVNYRGYGESEGSPTEKHLVGDAIQILDQVKQRYDKVILMGRSLGSGIAVQVAAQHEVDRLILVTPYDSITAVAQGIYPWAPVGFLIKDPFDSLSRAASVKVPALFLIAQDDSVIPMKHSRKLADRWGGPVDWKLIPGTTHNSISAEMQYWDAIEEFIRE
ncbi:MAG: alpha/beta hydrolase, partial [Verrucomicrobiae bacterium]|nr:alpha/beta hydrolase [Verrucomicrobiae bacterium]